MNEMETICDCDFNRVIRWLYSSIRDFSDNCHYLNPLFPKGKLRCIKIDV